MNDLSQLLTAASDIARRAGEAIAEIYAGDFTAETKADGSPVTQADLAANAVIVEALAALTPDIGIISEEGGGPAPAADARAFWLVDPLDGTRDFVKKNDEFCVCIALIEDRYPVLGVLYAPATGVTHAGAGPGTATRRDGDGPAVAIAARAPLPEGLVQTVSRSRPEKGQVIDFVPDAKIAGQIVSGSALKFALVAEGTADVYANLDGTSEWDTAAGQAVVEAAGGSVTTLAGARLDYAKPDLHNPSFIAAGREAASWLPIFDAGAENEGTA